MEPTPNAPPEETELGATGADLPLWRAREAIRHAEIRLSVQGSAAQSLEGRATSMLGWSVAGLLAVGAAVVNGTHFVAACVAGVCLAVCGGLCLFGILGRDFNGVAGYEPAILLADQSGSEYEALVALAEGYQQAVVHNHAAFTRFKSLLAAAMVFMAGAPISGFAALALLPQGGQGCAARPTEIRAASAWGECWSAPGWLERGSCGPLGKR